MSDFSYNSQDSSSTGSSDNDISHFDPAVEGRTTTTKVHEVVVGLSHYVNGMKRDYDEEKDRVSNLLNDQKKELANTRADNTKSLAVFVAFFTFVSISFSILPRVSQPFVLLGILLVILSALVLFVLLLAWMLDIQRDKWFTNKQIVVGVLSGVLLALGFISAFFGYKDMKNHDFYTQEKVNELLADQESDLFKKIEEMEVYTDMEFTKFKTCIAIHGMWKCLSE